MEIEEAMRIAEDCKRSQLPRGIACYVLAREVKRLIADLATLSESHSMLFFYAKSVQEFADNMSNTYVGDGEFMGGHLLSMTNAAIANAEYGQKLLQSINEVELLKKHLNGEGHETGN